MKKAIIGKKLGMTQIFLPDGRLVPVTVIQAGPCTVVQKKTVENDGYEAVQFGFDQVPENRAAKLVNKPEAGHFAKAGVKPMRALREFRLDDCAAFEVGQVIKADVFASGEAVDITGTTKGRGFTGPIYRWNHHTGPMAHGSKYHRGVGSMSANTYPVHLNGSPSRTSASFRWTPSAPCSWSAAPCPAPTRDCFSSVLPARLDQGG